MIAIRTYHQICTDLVDSNNNLEGFVLVAEDKHAVNKLTGKTGIWLVAVIPSADRSGAPGKGVDQNAALLFVIEKSVPSKLKDKELDQYETTQELAIKIRDYMETQQEDGCQEFWRLDISSIHIDPEYNIFGGWNGWSISFIF